MMHLFQCEVNVAHIHPVIICQLNKLRGTNCSVYVATAPEQPVGALLGAHEEGDLPVQLRGERPLRQHQEIVQFQRVFLQSLEEAIASEVDFHKFDHPAQFKNVLFALGNSFLYYADQFKLYSSFCASHSKAQKVLHPSKCKGLRNKEHVCPAAGEGNSALLEFLQSRNPKGQHSFSLESYLIKPIQRILKYPLLLQQLKHLTDPNSQGAPAPLG
ncbi:protein still life, isoform SIF type 1 [Caerostris extrusa]|uniref:Protein still life, isoform SIF type 1 n=1 Tax=Caerostris extrusa TaxID=172846 RepID=A0AAV4R8S8_CAEEX|nr:protein still life, isoform SIF type 1 [Caerostris extrusa]